LLVLLLVLLLLLLVRNQRVLPENRLTMKSHPFESCETRNAECNFGFARHKN
jgi:hypothetical protein